jgi:hypothetical protein
MIRNFERLMSPLIPLTKKGIRCTMISRQPIDGMELREMLLSMLLFVTHVRELKPSINDLLGCCNFCKHPSKSGKRLLRISSWDCLGLSLDMIPLGNCGPIDQGSSLQAYQDDLYQTATSKVVYA